MDSFTSFTPVSPVNDLNGDTTINVFSTPAFCPTPAALKCIEPTQLFSPIPSSEPIPINTPNELSNEFKWVSLSENISSDTDFSSSSMSGWSSPSNLSDDESDVIQFKWSQTP